MSGGIIYLVAIPTLILTGICMLFQIGEREMQVFMGGMTWLLAACLYACHSGLRSLVIRRIEAEWKPVETKSSTISQMSTTSLNPELLGALIARTKASVRECEDNRTRLRHEIERSWWKDLPWWKRFYLRDEKPWVEEIISRRDCGLRDKLEELGALHQVLDIARSVSRSGSTEEEWELIYRNRFDQ